MTALIQDAALWLLPPGLAGTAVAALRYRRTAGRRAKDVRQLEGEVRAGLERLAARDEEAQHLAEVRLPALTGSLWRGAAERQAAIGPLHPQLAETPFMQAQGRVLEQVAALAHQASEQAENAAQSAVQTVTRALQALVYEQQRAITAMLNNHHEEKVLADANEIDHASSQLARRAQIVAVLTGTWPGRQRDDSSLLDVVRGGVSRIRDYRRVRITGEPTEYVNSRIVEPVVLAVAELLDNAARHSEPGTAVDVWFVHAHNGISIVIDDAGIGLKPEDRELAARLLSGRDPVRLTELRNPPRLGFAGIGVLGARYGFRASVEQESVHGGVRAILHLDRTLLAPPPPAPQPYEHEAPQPYEQLTPAAIHPAPPELSNAVGAYPVAADGLPIRRRDRSAQRHPAAPGASQPPTDGGRNLAAFVRGTRSAHPAPRDEENTP